LSRSLINSGTYKGFRANFGKDNTAAATQIMIRVFAARLRSDISIGFISLSGDRLAFFKLSFSAKSPRRKQMPEQLGSSFPAPDRASGVRGTASAIWGVTILSYEIARLRVSTNAYAASGLSAVSPFSG
jgi:hypothetical protein